MAVEKAALDLTEGSMVEYRQRLDTAVEELQVVMKSVSKAAVRRRLRKAAEQVKFDQIVVLDPTKR